MFLKSATTDFLRQLGANNDRAWFDAHRDAYDAARKDFEGFVAALQGAMVVLVPELALLAPKDAIFRIFRDVRFSKDKTPYKKNFSAYFSKGGRKWAGAGYYLHVEPGGSFVAAGIWEADGPLLKKIRQELDYSFDEWKEIVEAPAFKKQFGGLKGDALVKPPAGYSADHPAAQYLKHKGFHFVASVPDDILHSKGAVRKIVALFTRLSPVVAFLNRAMPQDEG